MEVVDVSMLGKAIKLDMIGEDHVSRWQISMGPL
jgi:hypothetical protein